MAILFDITSLLEDQPEPETGNVIQFPAKVTAEAKLRSCRKMLAHWQHKLETADPRSTDLADRIAAEAAPSMVEEWRNRLSNAETEFRAWQDEFALTYQGRRYSRMAGRA